MADDDIQIGIDAGEAISGLGKVAKGFEDIARAAGLSNKELNRATSQMERSVGTVAGAIAKQSAARKADLRTISEQITAEQKLAAIQRAEKNTGVRTNSAGQAVNANSGQFVDTAQKKFYENQISLAERLSQRTDDLNRQRERGARQMQLETAFASKFYGVADQGAGSLRRVANVLQQIPPATWAAKLSDAQQRIMGMSNSTRYALYDVSTSFGVAGAAILGFGVAAITAAVSHERAFANVERTTQTTAAGYEVIRRQLEVMSMTLPVTFEDLTNIATAAGQLGIGANGIASFTSTVARLTATTNLTADAAGIALARFRAFFSEASDPSMAVSEATFSNLASSILKVGVNSIASESGIVNVAVQIASMGDYAGMTANQVIGLAGAMSSIGVAPELSRGTITRTFSNIGNAVSQGGVALEKFASLAGMSSQQFKQSWGTDQFANTFTRLVAGIKSVSDSGEDANLMLMELGFNSVRDRPLLLRLAEAADEAGNSGGLLAQTMRDAASGWSQNSELAFQYAKIATTTSARVQVLGQTFEQLFASMGQQSGGFLGEMAVQLTSLVRGFEEFSNSDAGKVFGTIAVQGALVVGAIALVVAAGARGAASLQGIGTAWEAIRDRTEGATTAVGRFGKAMRIANLALGLIGLVATIASVAAGISIMNEAAQDAKRGLQDVNGLVQAMSTDAENGSGGIVVWGEIISKAGNAAAAADKPMRDAAEALYGTGEAGEAGAAGVNSASDSMERAKYVFADTAREFLKAQLAQSDAFKDLYGDRSNFFGQSTTSIGVSAFDFDMEGAIDAAVRGKDMGKYFRDQVAEALNVDNYEDIQFKPGITVGEIQELDRLVADSAAVFQGTRSEIEKNIGAISAFGVEGKKSLAEISTTGATAAEMMSELDEVTQKTVDAAAQGFGKFVDVSGLISLTQKALDTSEEGIAAYEQAWADAYGGASFSLEQYLTNFRRAGEEQANFLENLQVLGASGAIAPDILADLSAMGPEANRLVQAMVDDLNTTGGEGLAEFTDLWGRTGYDSMVAFAVQAELGQQVISNVMASGGLEALRAFNEKLASGVGVAEALASLQLDIDGKPLNTTINKPAPPPGLTEWEKQQWANQNRLYTTATIVVNQVQGQRVGGIQIDPGYASGGYTGNGGKYDYAGAVHKGEFVMTAAATRAIGVDNLYSMMRAAQGGRAAPRGRGFAQGGAVTGGGMSTVIAYLSPEDRELLRSIQPIVRIGDREIARAQGSANFRTTRTGVG